MSYFPVQPFPVLQPEIPINKIQQMSVNEKLFFLSSIAERLRTGSSIGEIVDLFDPNAEIQEDCMELVESMGDLPLQIQLEALNLIATDLATM